MTKQQIENFRKVLSLQLGPFAFMMSDNQVEEMKNKLEKSTWNSIEDDVYLSEFTDELGVSLLSELKNVGIETCLDFINAVGTDRLNNISELTPEKIDELSNLFKEELNSEVA